MQAAIDEDKDKEAKQEEEKEEEAATATATEEAQPATTAAPSHDFTEAELSMAENVISAKLLKAEMMGNKAAAERWQAVTAFRKAGGAAALSNPGPASGQGEASLASRKRFIQDTHPGQAAVQDSSSTANTEIVAMLDEHGACLPRSGFFRRLSGRTLSFLRPLFFARLCPSLPVFARLCLFRRLLFSLSD